MSNLILLRRVRVLPHGPDRVLEQVVHRLNTSALCFRHAEENVNNTEVGEERVEQEGSPPEIREHSRRSFGNSKVYDPAGERADGESDGTNPSWKYLGRHDIGSC